MDASAHRPPTLVFDRLKHSLSRVPSIELDGAVTDSLGHDREKGRETVEFRSVLNVCALFGVVGIGGDVLAQADELLGL